LTAEIIGFTWPPYSGSLFVVNIPLQKDLNCGLLSDLLSPSFRDVSCNPAVIWFSEPDLKFIFQSNQMVAPFCGSGEQSASLTANSRLSAVFSVTAPLSGLLGHASTA
jgi:hypothetical protein